MITFIAHECTTCADDEQPRWREVDSVPSWVTVTPSGKAVVLPEERPVYVNGHRVVVACVLKAGDLVRCPDRAFFHFDRVAGWHMREGVEARCMLSGDRLDDPIVCLVCRGTLSQELFGESDRCPNCGSPWSGAETASPPEELL